MKKMKQVAKVIKNTILLCVVLLVGCTKPSVKNVTVLNPFDKVGHYDLKIQRSKKDPSNPLLAKPLITETMLGVNVLSMSEDSVQVEWVYGDATILGEFASKISEEEQKAINIYSGIKFDLTVKGNSQIHINNYSIVKEKLESLFLEMYGNDSITAESEMYARVKQMFKAKAGTPGLMLENFFPEVTLLFSAIDQEFNVGTEMKLDSVANPYGSGSMDILSTVTIESDDEGDVLVSKFDSIPQDVMEEKTLEYLNEIYGAAAANIPKDQMPQSTYLINLIIQLSKEFKIESISSEKQFSQGKEAMVNVLEVIIE